MTVKEFVEKAGKNSDLLKRMKAAKSSDEIFAIAQKEGVKCSKAEFTAEMNKLKVSSAKLSDKDLENVAGGVSGMDVMNSIIVVTPIVTPLFL